MGVTHFALAKCKNTKEIDNPPHPVCREMGNGNVGDVLIDVWRPAPAVG